MIGQRPWILFPRKSTSPARAARALTCNPIRLHHSFAKSLRTSPNAKLGLSLASVLGLIILGCSWPQLNLDAAQESSESATRHNSRGRRRHAFDDPDAYVRYPPTYTQISERTVSPGDNTGVTRYETAQLNSTPDRLTDFAANVLPVPSGYWSIFALISVDPSPASHRVLSWMRRNIVTAIAGSLVDVYNLNLPPPDADINEALRQTLARLDGDARADVRIGYAPWARHVSPYSDPSSSLPSTLLAFFDSDSRMLRIANAGAGRAFLGRRVSSSEGVRYECRELSGSGAPQYLLFEPDVRSRARDVEEFIVSDGARSRGVLDATSVEVESVEVRDGDFLVLGPHSTWANLSGEEAVKSVSGWMRERERELGESPSEGLTRGGRQLEDPFFDFPWKDHRTLGSGWVHTMIPDLFRDIDEMFAGGRENAASRVLRSARVEQPAEGSPHVRDRYSPASPGHLTSNSNQMNRGSVMVVVFTDNRK